MRFWIWVAGIVSFQAVAVDYELLKRDPNGLSGAVDHLEKNYKGALTLALEEAKQKPSAPVYWVELARIATEKDKSLSFAKNVTKLNELTKKISEMIAKGQGVEEDDLVLLSFHFKRTMVAVYVLSEYIKRNYLLEPSENRVSASDARKLEGMLRHLHLWAQGTRTQVDLLAAEGAKAGVESMIELRTWIRNYAPVFFAGIDGDTYVRFILSRPFSLRALTLPATTPTQSLGAKADTDPAVTDLTYLSKVGDLPEIKPAQEAIGRLTARLNAAPAPAAGPGGGAPAPLRKPLPPKEDDDDDEKPAPPKGKHGMPAPTPFERIAKLVYFKKG